MSALLQTALLARLKRKLQAGFTLLEVMIAVVILAVGLASLFTSEAGAVRIAQRARTTTIATLLARCKMAEVEEKVMKEGWPGELIEGRDECCEEGAQPGFACEWKVERIKMPDQDEDAGAGSDDPKSGGNSKGPNSGGMLDTLAGMSKQEPGERLGGITEFLSGGGTKLTDSEQREEDERDAKNPKDKDRKKDKDQGSQLDPMASMVMGMALPILKPVIEEGVRRASVLVKWKEGQREQEFEVVQFMVTEQQIILPDMDDDGDGGIPSAAPTTSPASTTTPAGTSSTSTPGAKR